MNKEKQKCVLMNMQKTIKIECEECSDNICPCLTCLIKCMCIDPCDSFLDLYWEKSRIKVGYL
jgi:hypothetical protein